MLQKDVSRNREAMIALDKTGTHLKYFSQKQDVILIRNLLSSVQHRWEKIVSRSAERTRHLERGFKEAKQYHDMWKELLDWLVDTEKVIDADTAVGTDPVKIKAQLAKHRVSNAHLVTQIQNTVKSFVSNFVVFRRNTI